MKTEHMLIAGAGGVALIYLLSKGGAAVPAGFGGGGGLGDALDSITTETITTPAGGDGGIGSILLPPPTPGKFFDVPAWVGPASGPAPEPSKKARVRVEQPITEFYREGAKKAGLPEPQAEAFTGMSMIGLKMSGILPTAKPKKDKIIDEPVKSYYEKIPGSGFMVGAKRLKAFLGDMFF